MINSKRLFHTLLSVLFLVALLSPGRTQEKNAGLFKKRAKRQLWKETATAGQQDRKQGIHGGNLIRTLFYNYGTIGFPYTQPAVEWPKGSAHNYIFEFGVVAAAEVVDIFGDTIHIVSEGVIGGIADEGGDVSPSGDVWGWQPLPGYAGDGQNSVAVSDNPDSWPSIWSNRPESWAGSWHGEYGRDQVIADQESYYVMDDRSNAEFAYFPDSQDSTRRGLGLEVEVRGYQWAQFLAEDCIFWVFEITNVGDKDLDKVVFGMYGDADVGGAEDWSDDDSFFDIQSDMVYQWDHDNRGIWGGEVGYFGFKYLESPGNPFDGIDNDGDGLLDERRDDGIDNDGDWRPERDDVGADGVPDTFDAGEGDGAPTAGEPNFDETDIDESDQIGLTSFSSFVWPSVRVSDDEEMWRRLAPGAFPQPAQTVDIVFLYGSGYFPLKAGQTQRFSIALLLGEDQRDLFRNADVVQKIYNSNYRFAKAPDKPTVHAVAADKRVTLYWDDAAEFSLDPISGEDFEGYRIYRATDPGFNEVRTITDGEGNLTFYEPIAQFDVKNGVQGFHPVDINGVQYFLGEDTGLQHTWTDTTVLNGLTYYYAVVSYDRGDTLALLPPTECTKLIDIDEAGNDRPDKNTAIVTPNSLPTGFVDGRLQGEIEKVAGNGTGQVWVKIVDPYAVKDDAEYELAFRQEDGQLVYQVTETIGGAVSLAASTLLESEEANQIFDGLHLFVQQHKLEFDAQKTGWQNGQSNYSYSGRIFRNGMPVAADYELRFGVAGSDDAFNLSVPFEVWNVTEGVRSRFALIDIDGDSQWSSGDDIVFLIGDTGIAPSWQMTLKAPESGEAIAPVAGDIFYFATRKPFTTEDIYRFRTSGAQIENSLDESLLSAVAVVPNPYVATSLFEPTNNSQFGRGERRINFINVPGNAAIRIYTVTGNLVKTLHNNGGLTSGTLSWDLLSENGIGVSYGVYIFHLEAPGIGEKIGKFALIK